MSQIEESAPAKTAKQAAAFRPLQTAVISSCSDRPLRELIAEIRHIDDVSQFDLLMLREIDIQEIERSHPLLPHKPADCTDTRTSTQILAVKENFEVLKDWLLEQLAQCNKGLDYHQWNRVSALATFFPEITSRSQEKVPLPGADEDKLLTPRELAVRALTNTVKLALALQEQDYLAECCWAAAEPEQSKQRRRPVIVEMVGGTILDRCHCSYCARSRDEGKDYAMVAEKPEKIRLLCSSLYDVWEQLGGEKSPPWTVSLELEPGPTYVLNGLAAMSSVFQRLEPRIAAHVGLNLDVAHMKIEEVQVSDPCNDEKRLKRWLREPEFMERIVHAHICDHPGMHSRDQVVGYWNPAEAWGTEDYAYLELLAEIARAGAGGRATGLPFSGTIALELEGCSRIGWIHRSLSALRHMLEIVGRTAPSRTPP